MPNPLSESEFLDPQSPSTHSSLNAARLREGSITSPGTLLGHGWTPAPVWLLLSLLLIIPLLSVNNFFAYHAPGAIGSSLQLYFGLDAEELGALFTIYSAPNVILVFVGGVWIDRIGIIPTSLFFNTVMLLGMLLFAIAPAEPEIDAEGRSRASTRSIAVLLTGRLLLGIGGECLCAGSASMLARWFRTGWLTFACGVNQALVQLLGSATAFWILPRIMVRGTDELSTDTVDSSQLPPNILERNVRTCLWVTVGVCILSLTANVVYVLIEWRYASKHMPPESVPTEIEGSPSNLSIAQTAGGQYQSLSTDAPASTQVQDEEAESEPEIPSAWSRVRSFSVLFWLVLLMHCLLSPVLYTFTAFGPVALMERYGVSEEQAGEWTSLLYVAIVLSPICGAIIDYVGYRAWWQVGAAATIPCLLGCMYLTDLPPGVIMICVGCAYAITECNGLAMIAVAVPPSSLGTAYGLLGCGISAALLFEPYLVGSMKISSGRYDDGTLMFIVVTAVGALCALVVGLYDRAHTRAMTSRPLVQSEQE